MPTPCNAGSRGLKLEVREGTAERSHLISSHACSEQRPLSILPESLSTHPSDPPPYPCGGHFGGRSRGSCRGTFMCLVAPLGGLLPWPGLRDSNRRAMQLRLYRLDRQGPSQKASAQRLIPSLAVACIQLCLRACEHAFGCEGSRANFCRCFPERKVPNRTPLDWPIGFSLRRFNTLRRHACSPADRPGPEAGDSNVPLFPFCQKLHALDGASNRCWPRGFCVVGQIGWPWSLSERRREE